MKVEIDHHGGWYRWKVTAGEKGTIFAQGKCATSAGTIEFAYAVAGVFCTDASDINKFGTSFNARWNNIAFQVTPAATEQSKKEEEKLLRWSKMETERCAKICEKWTLTLPEHNYTGQSERHLIAVVEAGCRAAFADAIRGKHE